MSSIIAADVPDHSLDDFRVACYGAGGGFSGVPGLGGGPFGEGCEGGD